MIRQAQPGDLESVVAIYNQAITARFQTAFMEPLNADQGTEWFDKQQDVNYPMFVYVEDGEVAGWFNISPYRSGRAALRYTVEISSFIHSDHQGKGIGSQLLRYGLNACSKLGYKTAISIVLDKNTPSIKLMEKFNFERWAFLPGVADFDGVECSHVYYGLRLGGINN